MPRNALLLPALRSQQPFSSGSLCVLWLVVCQPSEHPVTPDAKAETLPKNSAWPGSKRGALALGEGGED